MRIVGTVRSHRQRERLLLTLPIGPTSLLQNKIFSFVSDPLEFHAPLAPVIARAQGPDYGAEYLTKEEHLGKPVTGQEAGRPAPRECLNIAIDNEFRLTAQRAARLLSAAK